MVKAPVKLNTLHTGDVTLLRRFETLAPSINVTTYLLTYLCDSFAHRHCDYTGWLKIQYPTRQYAYLHNYALV